MFYDYINTITSENQLFLFEKELNKYSSFKSSFSNLNNIKGYYKTIKHSVNLDYSIRTIYIII